MKRTISNNKEKNKPGKIADILGEGEENALNLKQIQDYFGMKKREVYKRIQTEREAGIPILAKKKDGGGYFLPSSEKEYQNYIYQCTSTIATMERVKDALLEDYEERYKKSLLPEESKRA